ncbi:RagB/SusD family nutrient uptake outer membrane protein [Mucilaginibacter sp. CSA2-8R]|uniref:RagB/SusD family nutrient uptake outer membrane protein n=1 Tax=Mucilaginibacter sp. CSA2-8R TaxID=3141542 RepID=UPI00315DAF77
MKKILFLSTIASFLLTASCKKQLDQLPISSSTTATFYKSPLDFVQGTNAIYSSLHNYPNRLLNLSEIRSDNIYGVSVTVRDWDPINNLSPGIAANTYIDEAWTTDFNGVFKANTVLNQIASNGSVINSETLATRLQAEARFLRAFYYFDLIRYFGKLPIIDHAVTVNEAITIGRSPVDDVYKFIIADLQYAMANLPATYTGTDVGRATKWAAEGVLAQVYMARSGATYGIEGPGLGVNEWNLALPLLNDIITNGGFAFNTNFANVFSYTNQSPTVNKEAIFDVMYTSGISGSNDLYGASFPWVLAPNTYFSSLGSNTVANGSLEIIPVSNDLVNSYAANDVRKAFTINTAGYTFSGNTETRPFFKKYLDITRIPTTSRFDWAINFIALRYTDILMLKAECILRGAPGSQADVDAIVNQVRTRAGLAAVTGVTLPQLFEERRREFADEGSRWFDLQRSGNLVTIMNAWIAKEDTQKRINTATANYVIYPIPQRELNTTPGLYTQNPGY